MLRRAKTKNNLIYILSGILVTVFVCIVGIAFAGPTFTNYYTNNPQSSAYAANQQVVVVNDTLSTPIPFGLTGQGYEVSIQYSVSYDFDLRLKYSLEWTGDKDYNNVILTFANRDDYIVDGSYIYKASSVPAGSGDLTIITGVEFLNPDDSTYVGQTLTIKIDEVKFYKSYTKTENGDTSFDADKYKTKTDGVYDHPLYIAGKVLLVTRPMQSYTTIDTTLHME